MIATRPRVNCLANCECPFEVSHYTCAASARLINSDWKSALSPCGTCFDERKREMCLRKDRAVHYEAEGGSLECVDEQQAREAKKR